MNHTHEHDCCCGHHHDHEHNHHDCCSNHEKPIKNDANLTQNESDFIHYLSQAKYLPLASFVTKSSKTAHFEMLALSPIFIRSISDTLEDVRESGEFLLNLEKKGYITLDYDIPLDGYAYDEYKNCKLFEEYQQIVAEGAKNEHFLGDIATIEFGSIAIAED